MTLISYSDLARLRLRHFVGGQQEVWVEESGMIGIVGLGGFERCGETAFGWKQGEPYHIAGVTVDLGPAAFLPDDVGKRIIEKLRLPLRKGMTAAELIQIFGSPEIDQCTGPRRFLRFICGDGDRYLLGCRVDQLHGLVHFFLARKDYCDEDESL